MSTRLALTFVFITALLDSVGFGIIVPVLPQLIMEVTGEDMAGAALYGGWLLFAYAVMQFFLAPVIGGVSDRYGRRPVLLVSLFVLGTVYLIMYWAPTYGWLLLGRLIAGAAASTYSTCNAFVADVSRPEDRAANFGLMGAAFGVGFVLGPILGGLLGEIDPRAPFLAAAGLSFANLCYGIFALPESLDVKRRRPFDWRRANPTGTLTSLRRYPMVFGVLGAYCLFQLGFHVLPSTWSYFTMERFDWSPREVGYSLGYVGVLMVLVQAWVLRVALPRLGPRRAAFVGFLVTMLSFVGYAVSTQAWMIYAFLTVGALQGFATPAMQGIMANQVRADQQGELQGGLASLASLTAVLSPPLMTQIFATFSGASAPVYFPGAPYLLAAMLVLGALLAFARATASLEPPAAAGSAAPSARH